MRVRWLKSPIVCIPALILLLIDAVYIGRVYGVWPGPWTTMGTLINRVVGPGAPDVNVGNFIYVFTRQADGSFKMTARTRPQVEPSAGVTSDPVLQVHARYEHRRDGAGFWAPTTQREWQVFTCWDPATSFRVNPQDDRDARQALHAWFVKECGYPAARHDPTLGDFDRKTVLWGGVGHSSLAALAALLAVPAPSHLMRALLNLCDHPIARRRAALGLCTA